MSRNYMFEDRNSESRKKQRVEKQNELRQLRRDQIMNSKRNTKPTTDSTYSQLKSKLMSTDINTIYQSAYDFRNILSNENDPPIQDIIDAGVVPRFVELLSPNSNCYLNANPEIIINTRLECAWALTNIASGNEEQTKTVTESGAIPLLVDMINDENPEVIDQGIWALGNIAGDNEISRDVIIDSDVLPRLGSLMCKIIDDSRYIKLLRNATWLLSNLNRGRNPPPTLSNMEYSLSIILKLLDLRDPDTLNDAFWTLSYICDSDSRSIDMVISTNVLEKSMIFLRSSLEGDTLSNYLVCSIIRMIGNIVTGEDKHSDVIINMGFLDVLREIYLKYSDQKKKNRIRKEICWTISNIAAGSVFHVQSIFDKGFLPILVDGLNSEFQVKYEACWALTNIMSYCDANSNQFLSILEANILPLLSDPLEKFNSFPELQVQILIVIKRMLDSGHKLSVSQNIENPVLKSIINSKLPEIVNSLSNSDQNNVRVKAQIIIQTYFK